MALSLHAHFLAFLLLFLHLFIYILFIFNGVNLKSKSTLVYPICCIFFCRCIWSNGSQWECYHKMGYCRIEWWNVHGKFMSLKFFLLGICMFVSTFCIATSFNVRSVPFDSHVSGDSPAQISGTEENQKIHIWFAQIPGYFGGPNSNPHKWENYAPVPSICTLLWRKSLPTNFSRQE